MPRGNTIHIPPGYFSAAILAREVGVSPDTIKRWRQLGHLPYKNIKAGKLTIPVYNKTAVQIAKLLKQGQGALADRLEEVA